jgi:hypothetical protein
MSPAEPLSITLAKSCITGEPEPDGLSLPGNMCSFSCLMGKEAQLACIITVSVTPSRYQVVKRATRDDKLPDRLLFSPNNVSYGFEPQVGLF